MKTKNTSNPIASIFKDILALYLVAGAILRIVLMFFLPEGATMGALDIAKSLFVGMFNDAAMGTLLCLPMLLMYLGLNEWKYQKAAAYTIIALLVATLALLFFTHTPLHEYGAGLPRIAKYLVGYKLLSFCLRYFIPSLRLPWRRATVFLMWFVYVFLLIGNSIAEWFFWDEFGVRYNFIAVDYLIYTTEVVGNIMESYAIVPLLALTALLTAAIVWFSARRRSFRFLSIYTPRELLMHVGIAIVASVVAWLYLDGASHSLEGDNLCANQIQQNGCYDFVEAFRNNKLDYDQFYTMLPEDECRKEYLELNGQWFEEPSESLAVHVSPEGRSSEEAGARLARRTNGQSSDSQSSNRQIKGWSMSDSIAAQWQQYINIPDDAKPNIVLITVESLSAGFFAAYGNTRGITPRLDSLMHSSVVFDRLYAVGNRTVRGLEALSLCRPPSAGESIVKRPDNRRDGQTIGHMLASSGYKVQFLYGGDSYFDNMGDYFAGNGYEVVDRGQISDVTFSNIWGVCDEDLYRKALSLFDENARSQRPFFAQLMTVSNHRPYTFPAGKIQWQGDSKCRDAAVKYTDFAIAQFLSEARSHAWYDNTIFVIIADHCASSAGKTSIPIDRYHIPCIVHAPSMLKPFHIPALCSQIDVLPTLLTMLRIPIQAPTPFAGRNVLSDAYKPRAFMATYQDLGYLEGDILTVLTPMKQPTQYNVVQESAHKHTEQPRSNPDPTLIRRARTYYQFANLYQ